MSSERSAKAKAHANIALAKYWGKADATLNLPAVPSISMTLSPLLTETTVCFRQGLNADCLFLDGSEARAGELARAAALLSRVRAEANLSWYARVDSRNDFPTAAGLASSASGFCALAAAARAAAGLPFDRARISALSRQSSASAARSAFGGYVELPVGQPGDSDLAAQTLYPPEYWDLRIVVAVTVEGRKAVGSTDGMGHTEQTSPYYRAWVEAAPALADEVRMGLQARDLKRVGEAMEQSTLAMHACAMAAAPGLIYFRPATLAAIETVRTMRADGIAAYFTADAGPHVKTLCEAHRVGEVQARLQATEGVVRTLVAQPGPGVSVEAESST